MATDKDDYDVEYGSTIRLSGSPVEQAGYKFYMTSINSRILAACTYVSSRKDDPDGGFQRLLDERRALEISKYLDNGIGTIPQAVVLSAQPVAEFSYDRKVKLVSFKIDKSGFLIIDGQHRIFGFKMAKKAMRIPAIIYTGLDRTEETKLFIDINTKQKPVPSELLLDIKRLAEYEDAREGLLRDVFDALSSNHKSPLCGLMSSNARVKGQISRVTFNGAAGPTISKFSNQYNAGEITEFIINYLNALTANNDKIKQNIAHPTFFRAIMDLMSDASRLVAAKYNKQYTERNYYEVLEEFIENFDPRHIRTSGRSNKLLYQTLKNKLEASSSL